jgi:hypothetical protein
MENIFLVADTSNEFCDIILGIFQQPDAYKQIKQSACDFIAQNYTWGIIDKYILCDVVSDNKKAV